MNINAHEMLVRLEKEGLGSADALALRRISMTLHRWHELECGNGNAYASWSIERDEKTGKPYFCAYPHTGESRRAITADREKGALRRLAVIMARYPGLDAYVQTDPRGPALYVFHKGQTPTNGIAVYK